MSRNVSMCKIASGIIHQLSTTTILGTKFCTRVSTEQSNLESAQLYATNETDYLFEGHIIWTTGNVFSHIFIIIIITF